MKNLSIFSVLSVASTVLISCSEPVGGDSNSGTALGSSSATATQPSTGNSTNTQSPSESTANTGSTVGSSPTATTGNTSDTPEVNNAGNDGANLGGSTETPPSAPNMPDTSMESGSTDDGTTDPPASGTDDAMMEGMDDTDTDDTNPGGNMGGGNLFGGGMAGGDMAGGTMAGGDMAGGDMAGGDMSGGTMAGGDMGGTDEPEEPPGPVPDPPRIQGGQDGRATHYWDCCKPSCAWPDQGSAMSCTLDNQIQSNPDEQSGCFGGNAYQCWSMSPWAVSDTLAYGFAAFNSGACGTCYQLEFTGSSSSGYDDPGSASISHKIMIVQTVNRGGIAAGQFDLLVPGGGVGDFDACSSQWNATGNLGERYGGFFLECRQQNGGNHDGIVNCSRNRCQEMFADPQEADLLAGCLFWVDWANVADNPNFRYAQVDCPADLSAASGM